jgi:hypothetical protein
LRCRWCRTPPPISPIQASRRSASFAAARCALLFLPNVTRAFFVLVMSSVAGAAIGVTEGITIILRQAEQLPTLGDRLVLFAIGIVLFGIPLQAGFAVMGFVQRRLGRIVGRRTEVMKAADIKIE